MARDWEKDWAKARERVMAKESVMARDLVKEKDWEMVMATLMDSDSAMVQGSERCSNSADRSA